MARSPWLRVCAARLKPPVSDSLSLRLRDFDPLASPRNATRRFILQKTRRKRFRPRHLEGPRFQVLFHSPRRGSFHLSLTVLCAIGSRSYSALDRGRPGFGQGFTCPALLRYRIMETGLFRLRGRHPLRPRCPARSAIVLFFPNSTGHPHAALQPRLKRFGLLPVRSPLLGESRLISFPGLLRWFTSPSVASAPYLIQAFGWRNRFRRIAPFGNPGISGRSLLPLAFRSLPRPSSPSGSKASAVDLFSLGHIAPSAPPPSGRKRERASSPPPFAEGLLSSLLVCLPFPSRVKEPRAKKPRLLLEIRGFEPLTPGLQSRCSSQLSYIPFHSGRLHLPELEKSGIREENGF